MKTFFSCLLIIFFSCTAFSQIKEIERIDDIGVNYSGPGFVVGMDEQFNYVFLNTTTSNRFILFENVNSLDGIVPKDEVLTLKVQNGFFYASKFKYNPENPAGDFAKTDNELASSAIVKY